MKWVPESQRAGRRAICDECEHRKGVRCGKCGCFLIALQKLYPCPEGKF